MGSGISTSGIVLCFVPLALVIVGFVVAAYYTNRQATETYARIDPATAQDD